MYRGYRVGAVIPALNEEASIGAVVDGLFAQTNSDGTRIVDHIVVCDNGSTDQTSERAVDQGAEVVVESQKGYGRACLTAIDRLRQYHPEIVVFIDGDNTFEGSALCSFLIEIVNGTDLVIGSRSKGNYEKGSLSSSQIFGNQLATMLIRLVWGYRYSDLGPYRAIRFAALNKLSMADEAFGWTIEMQIKAIQHGLNIVEIPVNTSNRIGESRISGNLAGVFKAGYGILSTIAKLRLEQGKLNIHPTS